MVRYRWEARAQQRREMHAAACFAIQPSTVRIIRPAPSSSDDRSIGETELTTDAKITSRAARALRYVRGGTMACLVFSLLVGSRDYAYSQATAASQTMPSSTATSQTTPANAAASPTTPTAASQTTPTNTVDAGVGGISGSSFKFGEYNGLQNSGPFGIGNFDFRGGAPYDSKSTWRWQMKGTN